MARHRAASIIFPSARYDGGLPEWEWICTDAKVFTTCFLRNVLHLPFPVSGAVGSSRPCARHWRRFDGDLSAEACSSGADRIAFFTRFTRLCHDCVWPRETLVLCGTFICSLPPLFIILCSSCSQIACSPKLSVACFRLFYPTSSTRTRFCTNARHRSPHPSLVCHRLDISISAVIYPPTSVLSSFNRCSWRVVETKPVTGTYACLCNASVTVNVTPCSSGC